MRRPRPADVDRRFVDAFAELLVSPWSGKTGRADSKNPGQPSGSGGRGWCFRLRRVVLRQGGDDLDRFHADADDLSDEADDVLGVVGVVGVRADAAALVFLDGKRSAVCNGLLG